MTYVKIHCFNCIIALLQFIVLYFQFDALEADNTAFRENFHMSQKDFYALLSKVEPLLLPKKLTRSDVVPPKMKLAMVLE